MPDEAVHARLHVLLARDDHRAVVIRRGPSKQVATIGWDRRDDSFSVGQWLKARVYPLRSDLSPDGRHLILFVYDGRPTDLPGSAVAYTLISRAPYVKALCIWTKDDAWHGGGLFIGAKKFWLNDGYGHRKAQGKAPVGRVPAPEYANAYGGECPGVYFPRLLRDGWVMADEEPDAEEVTFTKAFAPGWVLVKHFIAGGARAAGEGVYRERHELLGPSGRRVRGDDWEWADVDVKRARVVWAAQGRLVAGRLGPSGLSEIRVLHEFDDMTFEPLRAPY